ncbi:MAG: hypothetical protein WBD40_04350 [Tepidisphaeraceae bacterium]
MSRNHPYRAFEKDEIWRALEKGIKALAKNGDLEERTARTHIVGYLTRLLKEAGIEGPSQPSSVKVIKVHPNEEVVLRRVGA